MLNSPNNPKIYKKAALPDRLAIERGLECPPRAHGKYDRYQWAVLEIGDSFLIPFPPACSKQLRRRLQHICAAYIANAHKKLPHRRFTQRTQEHGIRVWRIV
jgi:hypothetical protein